MEKRTPYRIVGQLWGTYILCEAEGTLIFVDQHAAHERILYEKLKRKFEERSLVTETLLLPVLMELSLEESLVLGSSEEAFEAIGFEIESVGERLYAIRSIPSFVEQKEAGREGERDAGGTLSFKEGRGGFDTSACSSYIPGLPFCGAGQLPIEAGRDGRVDRESLSLQPFDYLSAWSARLLSSPSR